MTPHFCKIQDYDESFYRQFHIVVCGLDSIVARRWINGMMLSLLNYEDDGLFVVSAYRSLFRFLHNYIVLGSVDQSTLIPIIDGGTEGFKGSARVILPGMTACIECTLDLYPPQVSYPLCTIATTPR